MTTGTTRRNRRSAAPEGSPVAVVGLGCRFPGAPSPEQFWDLLVEGRDAVREVPPDRWNIDDVYAPTPRPGRMSTRDAGLLDEIDRFDAAFFRLSRREADRLDPQQRLLLEVSWEALERACIAPPEIAGSRTGVYFGISSVDYYTRMILDPRTSVDAHVGTGNAHSIAANRLSYLLDLRGPSLVIDTACSSSLVAAHLAIQGLRSGESDMALIGGVNLLMSPELSMVFSNAQLMSPSGRCKTFDASADGYVRGEGCGVVVLKRLDDARADGDPILAVILGSAVNQDGATNGLTAPSRISQREVLRRAMESAGISPGDIGYFEAHGTGTNLGDLIEIEALAQVLGRDAAERPPAYIGSVKTNFGHLEAAAGVAGLIKVILSLEHQVIPPHLHAESINPRLPLDDAGLRIPATSTAWAPRRGRRLAGLSSFGFGGTNVHLVLEGCAPSRRAPEPLPHRKRMLCLSGRSAEALRAAAERHLVYAEQTQALSPEDWCYTANVGRAHFSHRLAVAGESTGDLSAGLRAFLDGAASPDIVVSTRPARRRPGVAFLFAGQTAQRPAMGRPLWHLPPFREAIAECEELVGDALPVPLSDLLTSPDHGELLMERTDLAQPALFAFEHALATLWQSWGVRPELVVGHSLGELVAACVAGVFSLRDGLHLALHRGRLMQSVAGDGCMLSLKTDERTARDLTEPHGDDVSIAAVNGAQRTVVSGLREAVLEIERDATERGISCRMLLRDHAFHSSAMDSIAPSMEKTASDIDAGAPALHWLSSLDGKPHTQAPPAGYWGRQMREAVRFTSALEAIGAAGIGVSLEIGPQPVLALLGAEFDEEDRAHWIPSLARDAGEDPLHPALARLYTAGVNPDWRSLQPGGGPVFAPTYPFQRRRHWLPAPWCPAGAGRGEQDAAASEPPDAREERDDAAAAPAQSVPVRKVLFEVLSQVSGMPEEEIRPEHSLADDLCITSIMALEMRSSLTARLGKVGAVSHRIFAKGGTVEDLLTGISHREEPAFDLVRAIASCRDWAAQLPPQGRIPREWVHKRDPRNVLLSDLARLPGFEDGFVARVAQDPGHPFFYEHERDHVPGLYVMEAARQFGTAITHAFFGVPYGSPFVLYQFEAEFLRFAEVSQSLFLVGETLEVARDREKLLLMRQRGYVVQDDAVLATVEGTFRVFEPHDYDRSRGIPGASQIGRIE